MGDRLRDGVLNLLRAANVPIVATGGGPVFQLLFQTKTPRGYRDTLAANRALYRDFAVAIRLWLRQSRSQCRKAAGCTSNSKARTRLARTPEDVKAGLPATDVEPMSDMER
jgi:glutamate-1-semialdehyde aminotransferase